MITDNNPHPAGSDEHYMYRALQLARRGLGWVSPNPLVGCVLVRDGQVLAEGWHAHYGEKHAEAAAVAAAGECRGATAYVSLEPCSHNGRQPRNCSTVLIDAGVSRVVYAIEDPDPRSHARSAEMLGAAGIRVEGGLLAADAGLLNDAFAHNQQRGSCFICLKLAMSLDGRIACANGHSQWLSGPRSLGYAHYLRQKHDAIMVGSGTVLADNPRLSTRLSALSTYLKDAASLQIRNACRVVLDPQFSLLPELGSLALADLSGDFRPELPRLLIAGARSSLPLQDTPPGVELLGLDAVEGRMSFELLADALWQRGIRSMLVEGGAGVAAGLLRQEMVHQLSLVYTPQLLGADAMPFSPALGLERVGDAMHFSLLDSQRLDDDMLLILDRKSV
ncbi:bifunctional diaminohydroxyphosphoribosylaminopyrimidine deaminase/5-amino-6-(5-phosphoribosylamino)uracil reductase RibD [bacterium]|nr:bifunctional diaminohydroxyphosphoribosylaminopyrimidine deaminase/5-amino-6-(5-phosphoribosylamino)uracil reductase RibD [bacterium]